MDAPAKHSMDTHNHDVASPEAPVANVFLEDRWVEVPAGLNVIEVARRYGKQLPHYCYHPKLEVVGNCRMCLFEMGMPKMDAERKPVIGEDGRPEINWMPRPQIGCATQVRDGMGIRLESPLAKECRKAVMEFLLINHPLDCPICDQAGECKLQQFSMEYGQAESRFTEEKVRKPKQVDIGERIILDDERCVLCTRCVRYAKDVLDDNVLGIVNRGGQNCITVHPDRRFDNDYSLNTVDICPVGALTSKDFRFQMRVWFLKETKSICTWDGMGCNVTVGSREGKVHRITPRFNPHVNSHWITDSGRLHFHYLYDERRLMHPSVLMDDKTYLTATLEGVCSQVGTKLKGYGKGEVAILASATMTNEELFMLRKLADKLEVQLIDVVPRSREGDDLLKSKDGNPNSNGARLMGVSSEGELLPKMGDGVRDGSIKALLCFHEDATEALGLSADDLGKLDLLLAVSILPNATTEKAHFVVAGSGWLEKRGTMINVQGRLQRFFQAVPPPAQCSHETDLIRGIAKNTFEDCECSCGDEDGLFAAMREAHPEFSDLTFGKIGDLGVPLESGSFKIEERPEKS